MSINELTAKVTELRELRRMAEELDAEIAAVQDSIKEHMTAQGVDELRGTDYKITWRSITSTRFDSKALRAELPEIAERFTRTTTTKRFTLTA